MREGWRGTRTFSPKSTALCSSLRKPRPRKAREGSCMIWPYVKRIVSYSFRDFDIRTDGTGWDQLHAGWDTPREPFDRVHGLRAFTPIRPRAISAAFAEPRSVRTTTSPGRTSTPTPTECHGARKAAGFRTALRRHWWRARRWSRALAVREWITGSGQREKSFSHVRVPDSVLDCPDRIRQMVNGPTPVAAGAGPGDPEWGR